MNNADKMREWLRVSAKLPHACTKAEHDYVREFWRTGIPQQYLDDCDKVGHYADFDEYFRIHRS